MHVCVFSVSVSVIIIIIINIIIIIITINIIIIIIFFFIGCFNILCYASGFYMLLFFRQMCLTWKSALEIKSLLLLYSWERRRRMLKTRDIAGSAQKEENW